MIKEVYEFPWEAKLASKELAALLSPSIQGHFLGRTQHLYEVRNASGEIILITGVALWSYVRPRELWIALAKPFHTNLRDSMRVTAEALRQVCVWHKGLVCEAKISDPVGQRFIRAFGLPPTGEASVRPHGEDYIQFEVI